MGVQSDLHTVVVGLGNPGKQYRLTRHNIGFLVADALASSYGWSFKEERNFHAYVAKGATENGTLHILLPSTYMNESGKAVKAYLDYYRLSYKNLIAIADDVALPFGNVRVRMMGSSGGHNGLKSLETCLGTSHYIRVRMGVDKKPLFMNLADYVLSQFSPKEFIGLPAFVDNGADIVKRLLAEDITHVMNTVNIRLESKPADLEKRSGEEV